MSYKQDTEEIIDFVDTYLDIEQEELLNISDEYSKAVETGFFGGRRISPEMAKQFSYEFSIRSDAVDIIKKSLIRTLKENFLNPENNA